jgi:hypothetical protein
VQIKEKREKRKGKREKEFIGGKFVILCKLD